jgi:hypothetical protein
MLDNKKIYVPHIVITDERYPKVKGKNQYIGARESYNFNHQQALEWISFHTKSLANQHTSYRIDMFVREKQAEEV